MFKNNSIYTIAYFLSLPLFCQPTQAQQLTPDFSARPKYSYNEYSHGSFSEERPYESPVISRPARPTFSGIYLIPKARSRSTYRPYTSTPHAGSQYQ